MDCIEVRNHLLDLGRGTLSGELHERVDSHLEGCAACRGEDAADRELSAALRDRLPKRRAPDALRRSIEARLTGEPPRASRGMGRTWGVSLVAAAAFAAAAVVALLLWRPHDSDAMLAEAVNDHLRVLYSDHPVEIESGGIHQVKPWFTGRLDFAPVVAFGGDDDFPLEGGAVAYFLDRKAATFIFKRRLHVITLFVFRAEGLPWPALATQPLGGARGTLETSRGFHVLTWRKGDLGYALVSDVDPTDLQMLAVKVAGGV
jgi:anti-sigma factor RsiW